MWKTGTWGDRPAILRDLFDADGDHVGREVFQLDEGEISYWREWVPVDDTPRDLPLADRDKPRRVTTAAPDLKVVLEEAPHLREEILAAAKRSVERTAAGLIRKHRQIIEAVERGDFEEASKLDDDGPQFWSAEDLAAEIAEVWMALADDLRLPEGVDLEQIEKINIAVTLKDGRTISRYWTVEELVDLIANSVIEHLDIAEVKP